MNTSDRNDLIRSWTRLGVSEDDQRALLRNAATIDRLNEAQCNGDWPCDNGERKVEACAQCACYYAPSVLLKGKWCPDCRAQLRVQTILARYPALRVEFNGDPRGYPFRIEAAPSAEVAR